MSPVLLKHQEYKFRMKLCESLQGGRLPDNEETYSMAPSMSRCTCTSVQPWLISQQRGKSEKNTKGCTLFSPFVPNIKHKNIVELREKIVVASQYGWLIVADAKDAASISLFDPFSRATIYLPRLDLFAEELVSKFDLVYLVMTCVPNMDNIDNAGCVLVATCKSIIMFCRPGYDDGWKMQPARVVIEGVSRELSIVSIATCNGIIYALLNDNSLDMYLVKLIIVSNNNEDNSNISDLLVRLEYIGHLDKMDWTSGAPYIEPQLVESCGELYCVFLFQGYTEYTEQVRVSKFVQKDTNADLMVVESLENRAFLVGINCNYACFAPETAASDGSPESEGLVVEGNCVYITSSDGSNYVYRLQDHTLAPLTQNMEMRGFWVTSATKKRKVDERCNSKAKSRHVEVKTETTICTIEEAGNEVIFGELPRELIALVATCLRLSDYSSFRSTCKKFRDSAPPLSQWPKRSAKIEYLKKHSVLPWLIHYNDDGICNVTDPFHANQPYLLTTPDWDDTSSANTNLDVACSKDGWLLMLGQAGHMFFYDPFNKLMTKNIKPKNLIDGHIRCVGYSAVPKGPSDECTIVALHSSSELLVCSYVYGDENWHIFPARLHHPEQKFDPANNTPVYFKDAFYFLDMKGRLAKLKVTRDHHRRWRVLCDTPNPVMCTPSTQMATYLLKCDGALWSVFVCLLGKWVRVFRLDSTKKRWSEAYNLEKYMIFLSPRSSFATLAPPTRPDLGNKLYFSRLGGHHHHQHRLICYDLRSRTYCLPTPDHGAVCPENFLHTRDLLVCAWIQPTWSET